MSHFIGFVVHGPSIPLVIVSTPIPDAYLFFQPKPIISIGEPSGSASTSASSPAPCALPKVCPPAVRATVSSSFIAIRLKVSLTSSADNAGSGIPFGPSGFT